MKTYISGQITGLPINDAKQKFKEAEFVVKNLTGQDIINPFDLFSPEEEVSFTWNQFMIRDITALLFSCDTIYMLNNWRESKGARAEHAVAIEAGMQIIYQ